MNVTRRVGLAALISLASVTAAHAAGTMQAAVVKGGKLVAETVPIPEPVANQVRVKVRAAGVNPVDYGMFASREGQIPGFDLSGTIEALGPGVTGWKVGDAVLGRGTASYAQYALVPLNTLAKKPAKMSFEEAAGLPIVGETAYRAIVETAKVTPGMRVLVHGGAGGVGSAAVQIAKAQGATVIATASARNHEYVKSIGASETIDYSAVKFEDKVKDVDVVVNTVDAETGERSIKVVKPGGIIVSVVAPTPPEKCQAANVRCARTDRSVGPSVADLLVKVNELAEAGKFKLNVDKTFTLANANDAWDYGRQKHTRGKAVITVPQ